uniref:CD34 molecule n=1 Tax=Leptobrachium leishanense TaxID=445787 RepID=A0A8C5MIC5_9ANUR
MGHRKKDASDITSTSIATTPNPITTSGVTTQTQSTNAIVTSPMTTNANSVTNPTTKGANPITSTIAVNTTQNNMSSTISTTPLHNSTTVLSQSSQSTHSQETLNVTTILATSLSENATTTQVPIVTTQSPTSSLLLTTREKQKQFHITCGALKDQTLSSEVVSFEYQEKVKCEELQGEQKQKLQSILCNVNHCNVTLYTSEVNPQSILWIPDASQVQALKYILLSQDKTSSESGLPLKWGFVSDHQTRSQKTMIALITCGILIAILILAGYFLSNTRRWSPGRQRLGEDPYYIETDSQGNTLVSVSTNDQNKPNSGSQENGKGQAITPSATNGHSTKKQAVSDTEL